VKIDPCLRTVILGICLDLRLFLKKPPQLALEGVQRPEFFIFLFTEVVFKDILTDKLLL